MLYRLEGVRRHYRMGQHTVKALDGIDLEIEGGAFHAIVGPSGSGKSTLLHLLGLLDRPTEGTVWFEGTDISSLAEDHKAAIRNQKVGFIFQQYHLIPVLNAYENIELPFLQNKVFSRQEIARRIEQLIEAVGLQGYGAHRPAELSGGQQQRVAIARALAMRPRAVLADEPTANLDSRTGEQIIETLRRLNQEEGVTCIFSTHDPMVIDYCDRVWHIKDGVIVSREAAA